MTEPVEARLARLEGVYEQIDRRLGSVEDRLSGLETKVDALGGRLDAKIDALGNRLDAKIDAMALEVRREVGALNGRIHALLYGIIVAALIPILIRVFFP